MSYKVSFLFIRHSWSRIFNTKSKNKSVHLEFLNKVHELCKHTFKRKLHKMHMTFAYLDICKICSFYEDWWAKSKMLKIVWSYVLRERTSTNKIENLSFNSSKMRYCFKCLSCANNHIDDTHTKFETNWIQFASL